MTRRKFKNSAAALAALQKMTKNGKVYTPVQVYNSAQRSAAWARKLGNPIEQNIWKKVQRDAAALVVAEYAKARAEGTFIPCDENCMGSYSADCDCSCGGVNHGIHAAVAG